MSTEIDSDAGVRSETRPSTTLRPDRSERSTLFVVRWAWDFPQRLLCLALLGTAFVLFGGGKLDPGPIESRLGLAAAERLGPFGQVFGSWDPSVWVGQLVPSLLWAWGEGGMPTSASVRWPAAIAGVAVGLILARRASSVLGGRAGVLVGLCWYGSLALMDRSAGAGLDLITALGTVAALDRLLGRGSDLVAGCWAALAFLAGGWPPVAVVALTTLVIGRPSASLSWRLLFPPALAAAGWSAWALSVAPAEAWAAALTLPLTQKPAWLLIPGVLALGLPWTPFAALTAGRSVRDGWPAQGRALVIGWLQVAGACLLAGTLIPGLAGAAKVPALAGLAVAAGACCERMLVGGVGVGPRRWFFGATLVLLFLWTGLATGAGGYLAAAVPYYRAVCVTLIALAIPAAGLAVWAAARGDGRKAFLAVFALAVFLKVAHWGYYVPEWNYRRSQGPWGRAVGQWVPPRWTIYTAHTWGADFAFATGHPVRQLVSAQHLAYEPAGAKFVLLLASEFENWPSQAPPLTKVASFQDEYGGSRVLARTEGPLPWDRTVRGRASE